MYNFRWRYSVETDHPLCFPPLALRCSSGRGSSRPEGRRFAAYRPLPVRIGSELHEQPELQQARADAIEAVVRRRDASEGGAIDVLVPDEETGMVRDVKRVGAELNGSALGQTGVLGDREVVPGETRSVQDAALQ